MGRLAAAHFNIAWWVHLTCHPNQLRIERQERGLDNPNGNRALALADPEQLRPTGTAGALRGGAAILQRDCSRAGDFLLGPTLEAVCIHDSSSF